MGIEPATDSAVANRCVNLGSKMCVPIFTITVNCNQKCRRRILLFLFRGCVGEELNSGTQLSIRIYAILQIESEIFIFIGKKTAEENHFMGLKNKQTL